MEQSKKAPLIAEPKEEQKERIVNVTIANMVRYRDMLSSLRTAKKFSRLRSGSMKRRTILRSSGSAVQSTTLKTTKTALLRKRCGNPILTEGRDVEKIRGQGGLIQNNILINAMEMFMRILNTGMNFQ